MTENRIDRTLQALKQQGKKALIPFVTAGHGGYDRTEQLVLQMEKAGADIIELGVPFSDPIAEGPVIQHASEQALKQGTTLAGIFELVKRLRKKTDMPFEEKDEIQGSADKYHIHNISLVTPASEGRIQMIAEDATGFLYCVSSNGVTGMRTKFQTDFSAFFTPIHKYAKIPCMVGFGISSPEAAKQMSQYCDGVIVGSAIVNMVEQYQEQAPEKVYEFVKSLRTALDE